MHASAMLAVARHCRLLSKSQLQEGVARLAARAEVRACDYQLAAVGRLLEPREPTGYPGGIVPKAVRKTDPPHDAAVVAEAKSVLKVRFRRGSDAPLRPVS